MTPSSSHIINLSCRLNKGIHTHGLLCCLYLLFRGVVESSTSCSSSRRGRRRSKTTVTHIFPLWFTIQRERETTDVFFLSSSATADFLREDTMIGTSFLRVAAHDDDFGTNAAITYSMSNEQPEYLKVNPLTGWVYVNQPISQVQTKQTVWNNL